MIELFNRYRFQSLSMQKRLILSNLITTKVPNLFLAKEIVWYTTTIAEDGTAEVATTSLTAGGQKAQVSALFHIEVPAATRSLKQHRNSLLLIRSRFINSWPYRCVYTLSENIQSSKTLLLCSDLENLFEYHLQTQEDEAQSFAYDFSAL